MSLPEITQENVHIFIPFKVAKVTKMIADTKMKIGRMYL